MLLFWQRIWLNLQKTIFKQEKNLNVMLAIVLLNTFIIFETLKRREHNFNALLMTMCLFRHVAVD